ncbi:MAG TPA: DUF6677 family protein [Candidatus Acidoferrales bacterium]|nr:DUF6677 family protein [Candidatus Acidoferrales bacterium]
MSVAGAAQAGRGDAAPGQASAAGGVGVLIAGWLVPGLGHVLKGRWGRGIVYFVVVGALAVTGYLQRGYVFSPHYSDAFSLLGFLADAGAGVFYFAAKWIESAGPDISRAAGDYGTRFIAAAGVLNVLCAFDALAIARRERD